MSKLLVDSCVFINAFKEDSEFRDESRRFLSHLLEAKQRITMPAHGWFEVWCNLKRIEKIDKKFDSPSFNGLRNYPVELIHIDDKFILKYGNIELPYIKAGDHIYLVIAHVNKYKLVTWDNPMISKGISIGIDVQTPTEFLASNA